MSEAEDGDSFARWQGLTIAQLTQAVSVVLGLAVAALGFDVTLLMNNDFKPASWQKCAFGGALLLLLSSIALGIWCIINRLRDFRLTMWSARDRTSNPAGAAATRAIANALGKKTWALFWGQIVTFGLGVLLTVIVVAIVHGQKLL